MAISHQEQFRQSLVEALERELVGPDLPPHGVKVEPGQPYVEILEESPTQRYSAGVLFPQSQPMNEIEVPDESSSEDADDEDPLLALEDEQQSVINRSGSSSDSLSDAYDETVRLANEFFPSAIGLSCLCEIPSKGFSITVKAARYESQKPSDPEAKRTQEWRRVELEIPSQTLEIPATRDFGMKSFPLGNHLELRAMYRRQNDASWLVTVSLLNTIKGSADGRIRAADCFFQVGIEIEATDRSHVFREYRAVGLSREQDLDDPDRMEEAALDLLYRKRKAFAVGHGCSVDWGDESNGRVNRIETAIIPKVKVPPVEPRSEGGDELSMYFLSGADGTVPPEAIPTALEKLGDDYEAWIVDQESQIGSLESHLQKPARANMAQCRDCLKRVRDGIALLKSDTRLLEAFMLANRAVRMQQVHAKRPKRPTDQPFEEFPKSYAPTKDSPGRWRAFQLAFMLMNLSSITPLDEGNDHPERSLVDLIWFPTGGGKTEAYLGLAATDIFLRRLTRPSNAGCTVLMRYTLRLLTAQQFQRASSMICACELIRRERSNELGDEPITIGLWVGESLTPLYRQPALKALNNLAKPNSQEANEFQSLKCPWCGTALDEPDNLGYVPDGKPKTVIFVCPERECAFSTRKSKLPVVVIDEDVYESPPTLIIGTVDKFAMLAWREQAGRIFGVGMSEDRDPPDLIIQDELHLISGPLGSVVGLYETAIDLLCSWKGRKPKIVASTATIRRAWHQCKALYDRETSQFPPQGLDISDSFFAKENPDSPGRVYVGVFATAAPSFVTAMVRTLGGLFQSCNALELPSGATEETRDPYWTILQYFSSLRELGHAATLVEADIPEYMWSIATRTQLPKELCRSLGSPVELTSRRTADEIPEILERLEVRHPRKSREPKDRPLDTLLATNMISVGVDVDRLGLMVIVGQPKTTSEYIQASSRVGRSPKAPGLIVTMYNPGKPRDRSHYEHFRAYHEAI